MVENLNGNNNNAFNHELCPTCIVIRKNNILFAIIILQTCFKNSAMKTNRRNFLRLSGLTGLIMAGEKILNPTSYGGSNIQERFRGAQAKHFNMCGYAAPKL